jgi:hypothetical protein
MIRRKLDFVGFSPLIQLIYVLFGHNLTFKKLVEWVCVEAFIQSENVLLCTSLIFIKKGR